MGGEVVDRIHSSVCKNEEEEEEKEKEKDEGENGTSTSATRITMTRIFVGGLGGTVTAEDLRTTFSSLGKVESVQILRTKGRSFAYFDFHPSSHNSLSKLFSTYNGCMWKGGRLRLEKAKEHYLLRLSQEWAEDAKLANSAPSNAVDSTKNMGSPEKLNNVLNPEKMEVRLFFPKFRKVKSLPFSGTGKHKYSFQRVEVPPLPTHFCDCEEHSYPSHTAKEKVFSDLETQGGGIDEKELNVMKSVMNKLFERENIFKAACSGAGSVKEGDDATKSVDDLLVDENETNYVNNEDNLVMNMVAGGKNRTALLESQGQETIFANEGAIFDELQTSKDRPSRNVLKSQRRKIVPSDNKRKSSLSEGTDGNEDVPANPEKRGSAKKTRLYESAQTIGLEPGIRQSNTSFSWSQKSRWRDLDGERGNTSFRISHIMQTPNKEESKSDGVNVPFFTDCEHQNLGKNINLESQSGCFKEPNELATTQPSRPNEALSKAARGASWLQKSSWTQLVGELNSSFSISQLLPGMTSEKQEQAEPKSMDAANSIVSKYSKLVKAGSSESSGDGSKASGVGNMDILTAPDRSSIVALATGWNPERSPQKNLRTLGETDEITAPKNNHTAPALPSVRSFTIGESCSFMRSASSVREWMNTKAALSASLKKKT